MIKKNLNTIFLSLLVSLTTLQASEKTNSDTTDDSEFILIDPKEEGIKGSSNLTENSKRHIFNRKLQSKKTISKQNISELIETIASELNVLKSTYDSKINRLNEEILSLKKANNNLTNQLEKQSKKIENLNKKLNSNRKDFLTFKLTTNKK